VSNSEIKRLIGGEEVRREGGHEGCDVLAINSITEMTYKKKGCACGLEGGGEGKAQDCKI
jgi:hypothetical protein